MTSRAKALMFVVLAVLGVGFLYLHSLARRISLEVPQHAEEGARAQLTEAALRSPTGLAQTVTLYFPSDDEGMLVAESRDIAWASSDSDRVRQILLALIEGSREGRRGPLPPTAEVRAVFLTSQGTAYIDFSGGALSVFAPGIESETLAVYSIVDSLATNIPTVKRVRFLVQGHEVETLSGHVDLSDDVVPDVTPRQPAP